MMMMMMTMMMMSQSSNESYLLEYDKRNRSIARGARAGRHLERRGHIRGHQGAATGSGGCQNGLGRLALVRRPAGANLRGRYPPNIKKPAIESASLCRAGIHKLALHYCRPTISLAEAMLRGLHADADADADAHRATPRGA